jgi:glyoxylate reductase
MANILVTRNLPGGAIARLAEKHTVDLWAKPSPMPRDELIKRLKDKDAILCLLTDKIDDDLLKAAPKLRIVSNYAVGYDNIDIPAATKRKILVTNTPGVPTDAVAEHTFALMMAITRRIVESDKYARAGKYKGWAPDLLLGTELKGRTLGIIGLGRIGSEVARRAVRGMLMNVLYTDIKPNPDFEKAYGARFTDLRTILKEADVVSLHVPLLPTTRHLIGEDQLRMMKKGAYLINTARGPVIDEAALLRALQEKWIAGAGIDVFEHEPLITKGLEKLDNIVITPHTASATIEARSAMADVAVDALIDFFSGRTPQNVVNKDAV